MSDELNQTPAQAPATDTPSGENKGEQNSGANATPIFTTEQQEYLNRIAGEARKSGRQSAISEFLKELGFESADDVKTIVTDARKRADAEKTETQRLTEALARLEKERDEARQQYETERQTRITERRNSLITSKAHDANAEVPADVITWAKEYQPDMLAKTVNDKGEVDEKAIQALVEACKAARPSWFKQQTRVPGSPSNSSGRASEPNKEEIARAKQDARNQTRSWF